MTVKISQFFLPFFYHLLGAFETLQIPCTPPKENFPNTKTFCLLADFDKTIFPELNFKAWRYVHDNRAEINLIAIDFLMHVSAKNI